MSSLDTPTVADALEAIGKWARELHDTSRLLQEEVEDLRRRIREEDTDGLH